MSSPEYDHPDLTAYALGELAPADAAHVRRWLAQSAEARAELERIQEMIGVLQDGPALPKRSLDPRRRETVLGMGQIPEIVRPKNVVPFLGYRRPAGAGQPAPRQSWRLVKMAVAACVTVGAFVLGQRSGQHAMPRAQNDGRVEVAETTPKAAVNSNPAAAAVAIAGPATPLRGVPDSSEIFTPVDKTPPLSLPPAPARVPVITLAQPEANSASAAPVQKPAPPAATAAKPVVASNPAPAPSAPSVPVMKGFASNSSSTEAHLPIHPPLFRPLPVPHEFAGVVLASPMSPDMKPDPAPRKQEPQPALVIHSWKAEIASCPWDPARRLMRFVAQIPVAQSGIEDSDRDYKLVAKFDPFQVQGFRLVTEKHLRAAGGSTQATRFAWYEIIPTRNFNASADKPVTIGSITIEQPRGSSGGDAVPLKLVDRGQAWSEAREDFVFETAMIGWNLLLSGTENVGSLNSKLVLDIAEKTRGEDEKGERAKFINVIRQAQRAVGL